MAAAVRICLLEGAGTHRLAAAVMLQQALVGVGAGAFTLPTLPVTLQQAWVSHPQALVISPATTADI